MVAHAFRLSTREVDAGRSHRDPGQPGGRLGLQGNPISKSQKGKQQQKKTN